MLDKEQHFRSMVWSERVIERPDQGRLTGPDLATPVLPSLAKGGFGAKLGSRRVNTGEVRPGDEPSQSQGRAKEAKTGNFL
jgi:hypothetical protein